MFAYGPAWEKKAAIQNTILGLTESDILVGAKQIYNHALNPSTAPKTSDLEELNYINDQNTALHKKSKLDYQIEAGIESLTYMMSNTR